MSLYHLLQRFDVDCNLRVGATLADFTVVRPPLKQTTDSKLQCTACTVWVSCIVGKRGYLYAFRLLTEVHADDSR